MFRFLNNRHQIQSCKHTISLHVDNNDPKAIYTYSVLIANEKTMCYGFSIEIKIFCVI